MSATMLQNYLHVRHRGTDGGYWQWVTEHLDTPGDHVKIARLIEAITLHQKVLVRFVEDSGGPLTTPGTFTIYAQPRMFCEAGTQGRAFRLHPDTEVWFTPCTPPEEYRDLCDRLLSEQFVPFAEIVDVTFLPDETG